MIGDADTVLVTGGTGVIGRAIVEAILRLDATVAAISARPEGADALLAAFPDAVRRRRLHTATFDLAGADASAAVIDWLAQRDLRPTGFAHAARSLDHLKLRDDGSVGDAAFAGEFALAVMVPYRLTLALANAPDSALRSVVFLSSMYGMVAPNPNLYPGGLADSPANYGVAKAAMLHLTKELAVRLAPRVRVNAVSFGGVGGRADAAFAQRYGAMSPNGRMLRADETVGPVLFLLDDAASSAVIGANLVADGGWTLW